MAAARGAVGVKINVGAAFAQCSSKCKCTSLAQSTKTFKSLPVFGVPSPTEDRVGCLIETVQEAKQLIENVVDLNALI